MVRKRDELTKEYYANKISNASILIDNIWDPHNVAAIARTADGLGIRTIYLYYSYNEFPNFKKLGKKSSASANKWIEFRNVSEFDLFVREKKQEGFCFIGADMNESAQNLGDFLFPDRCVLVFGSEKKGISPEVKKVCDSFVFIPMVGMVKSYNVSVSASIVLYELFRQKGRHLKLRF